MQCYCGSNKAFSACCGPIIDEQSATSAEQLMRSRYSAYADKRYDYVLATYTPVKQSKLSITELAQNAEQTEWLNLEVLHSETTGSVAYVEFIATYRIDNEFWRMHEISSFKQIEGQWYYDAGKEGEHSGKIRPERNALCPCGSQKKFKKCCLR